MNGFLKPSENGPIPILWKVSSTNFPFDPFVDIFCFQNLNSTLKVNISYLPSFDDLLRSDVKYFKSLL